MDINSKLIRNHIEPIIGYGLSDIQVNQFLIFFDMVIEKNKVMNLTGITDFEEFVIKHFADSLEINRVIDLSGKKIELIDIGTGAGFPGIPLKIIYPDVRITLFDSLKKRLVFLDEVISKLELKDIITLHGRAEEFGRKLEYREKYDIVVSRAVAGLNTLCEISIPFCKIGGYFISYKGSKGNDELDAAKSCISILGGKLEQNVEYKLDVQGVDNARTLIKIQKIKATNNKYPRGSGKPFNSPLYLDN